ncbi:MAG: transcriptional repressor LexA [Syntrophomonadaceae bacterium]|nr:transcriptional repressor LexA [Syntrophomonadaceae bacterium]
MGTTDKLSKRQKLILDFIQERIKDKGYPPSVREIGAAVGLKSSSTVHAHLMHLEGKGYIRKDPSKPRAVIPIPAENEISAPDLATVTLPVIGQVAAGIPILASENIEAYFPIPVEFVGSGNHYILKVKGESMIEAGIMDGDYLIVRQQADAANGEIVVAMLEDEATVKRYYKRDRYIELKPENSSMQPIITQDAVVLGKVTGLLRHM